MITTILLIIVAIEHLVFGYVEMFGSAELQSKSFGFPAEELKNQHLKLALSNQGIYNIALGLLILVSVFTALPSLGLIFLMAFVVIVGIYGGATVHKKIYLVQALPALITLVLLLLK
jgi:putative membrane protein